MRNLFLISLALSTFSLFAQTNCVFVENQTSSNIASDGESTYGTKLGDLDGDGDLDAVTIHSHDFIQVKINDGTGVFGEADYVYSGGEYFRLELADVDDDNDLDIVALSFGADGNTDIWKNDGTGQFSLFQNVSSGIYANHSKLADLDGDGDLDLFQTARIDQFDQLIFKNDGNGTFTLFSTITPNTYSKAGVALADFDGDGDIDAVMSSASSTSDNEYWTNDGNGNFTYVASYHDTLGSGYYGIDHGDFDNDGDEDFVVLAQYTGLQIYLNDGAGNFTYSGMFGGAFYRNDVQVCDYNNDGNDDIISVGSMVELLANDGNTQFDSCWADDNSFSYSFNSGDLDSDGFTDIYAGTSGTGSDRVFIQKPNSTNISDISTSNNFTIFPNPATSIIKLENLPENTKNIQILDVTGKMIVCHSERSEESVKLNVTELQNGIYFIKAGNQVQKLIKE